MSYEERRVRVKDYGTLPRTSALLEDIPGTGGRPRRLHRLAAEAFRAMAEAAKVDLGIELRSASAWRPHRWRSFEHYKQTVIKRFGSLREGRKWLGFASPHETGLAVDFGVGGLKPSRRTRKEQRKTALHKWLVKHAHEYGWHPYKLEPWHWEYPMCPRAWETGEPDDIGAYEDDEHEELMEVMDDDGNELEEDGVSAVKA